jgi:hypothetical protein
MVQIGFERIVTKKPDYSSSGDEMSTLTRTSSSQSFSPAKKSEWSSGGTCGPMIQFDSLVGKAGVSIRKSEKICCVPRLASN